MECCSSQGHSLNSVCIARSPPLPLLLLPLHFAQVIHAVYQISCDDDCNCHSAPSMSDARARIAPRLQTCLWQICSLHIPFLKHRNVRLWLSLRSISDHTNSSMLELCFPYRRFVTRFHLKLTSTSMQIIYRYWDTFVEMQNCLCCPPVQFDTTSDKHFTAEFVVNAVCV